MIRKLLLGALLLAPGTARAQTVTPITPPEQGFYSKMVSYQGIPIKAPAVVSDEALREGYKRLSLLLTNLPGTTRKLVARGAQLHIIGRDQNTSDLPEFRSQKGVPQARWGGQTIDERTRGLGGLMVSCGEENLLRLPKDRYRGRDICLHEFSHCIRNQACSAAVVAKFDARYRAALAEGRWVGSYAASNPDEFFAELTMWYFGTHGDMNITGRKPADGRAGLRAYDPESFALFDEFYGGRLLDAR